MKELIGKTIKRILVGEIAEEDEFDIKNRGYLVFETDYGDVSFVATGECCSESYISDINRIENILGQKVLDVKKITLWKEEEDDEEKKEIKQFLKEELPYHKSRQEVDEIYGFHIITKKGIGLIIMRNSSNGYYGGYLEKVSEEDHNFDKSKLIEVKKDYNSKDYFRT